MAKIFIPANIMLIGAMVLASLLGAQKPTDALFALREPAVGFGESSLKVWGDGTAYISGVVKEHNLPCPANGGCYLRLQVDDTEVRVVYEERRSDCVNSVAAGHAQAMKKGDRIRAFGGYSRTGHLVTISTCASRDYFIQSAGEGIPVGPVTERFFSEVDRLKDEAGRKQFSEAQRSGRWEIYKDEKLGYEFSYPATWQSGQTSENAPWSVTYHDFSRPNSDFYTVTLGYISNEQQARMGIDFCTGNLNSSRCETRQIGKVTASIDWGDNSTQAAFVQIPLAKGGVVTLTLKPNTAKAKSVFLPILDTFKIN